MSIGKDESSVVKTNREAARDLETRNGASVLVLLAVSAEVARARQKFPGRRHLLAALMEEVGELAQAMLQGRPRADVNGEAVQVACLAVRLIEEGDSSFESPEDMSPEDEMACKEVAHILPWTSPTPRSTVRRVYQLWKVDRSAALFWCGYCAAWQSRHGIAACQELCA